MFCQNCGNQNGDGSLFCESCGAKLIAPAAPAVEPVPVVEATPAVEEAPVEAAKVEEAAPVVEPTPVVAPTPVSPVTPVAPVAAAAAPKEKKGFPFNPLMIVAAVEAVVLIIAIVVFATTLKKANNYEKTACEFWNKLAAGKYEAAYDYLYIDDDEDSLTKESFVAAMKAAPYAEAEKVKIKKSSASDSKGKFKVNFEYNDDDYSLEFTLVKKNNKWKVNAESFTDKVSVNNVPAGADLYVDGVKVASKKESADKYDEMKVVLFEGTHEFYAKVDVFETAKTISASKDVYVGSLRLSEEENEVVCDKAMEIADAVAKAAVLGEGFEAIEDYFTDSQNSYSTNEDEYEYWENNFFATNISSYSQDQSGITKLEVSDMTAKFSYIDTYSNATKVSVVVNGTKTYEYKYYDATDMAYDTEKVSDPESFTLYVEFIYEDGEWLAVDIDDFYSLRSYSRY